MFICMNIFYFIYNVDHSIETYTERGFAILKTSRVFSYIDELIFLN